MLDDIATRPWLKLGQKENRETGCTDKGRVEAGGRKNVAIPLNFSIIDLRREKRHLHWEFRSYCENREISINPIFGKSCYLYNHVLS